MVGQKIVKNAISLLTADVIGNILGFFFIVVLARMLGDIGLGVYSFAFAFVGLFALLVDFGLDNLYVRDISRAKGKASDYFTSIFWIRIFCSVLVLIALLVIISLLGYTLEKTLVLYVVSLTLIFSSLNFLYFSVFRAFEVMHYESIFRIIERFLSVGLGILVLLLGYELLVVVLVIFFAKGVQFFGYAVYARKFVRLGKPNLVFMKKLFIKGLPFWLTVIFMFIYFRIDTVMLSFMKGDAVVGWYNAAYKMIFALNFIPYALVNAVFPSMSILHKKGIKALNSMLNRSFKYLYIIALPVAVGTTLLSARLILFIYQKDFSEAVLPLQILIWAEVLMFITFLFGFMLNSIDKQKIFTISTGICAIFNILANFYAIYLFSHIGASVTTLLTELLNLAILYFFIVKSKYFINYKILIAPLISAILMAVFIKYFVFLHLLILVPLAAVLYFIFLFVFRSITKEDIDLILGLLGKPSFLKQK